MTRQGRPIRFLGVVLGAWTLTRVGIVWPTGAIMPEMLRVTPPALAATARPPGAAARRAPPRPVPARTSLAASAFASPAPNVQAPGPPPAFASRPGSRAPIAIVATTTGAPSAAVAPGARPLLVPSSPGSRLTGSGWLLVRGQGALATGLTGTQLGGAQGGFRLAYALDGARRLSLTARLSSALHMRQREAALGLAWKPTRAPVTLVAEQRVGLAGERGGPTLGVIAGLNPTPVTLGFRLEAYGQAGAIKRGGLDKFADGAMRLARPVGEWGPIRLDLGAGAWGGAQPGAARLDIGPSASVSLRQMRLTLDWRQRVTGGAHPGSGLALSLGTDF